MREIGNGKAEVSKSLLAARLKVSETSGDFITKIASAKCYGIIEGKTSFTLTPAARTYFFPTVNIEREKKQSVMTFFASPGAFAKLIETYDGSKPDLVLMGNVLHEEMGIPDSWKGRVAKFFMRSAEYAGAIDSGGFLRFKAHRETIAQGIEDQGDDADDREIHHDRSSGSNSSGRTPARREALRHVPQDSPDVAVWTYPCGDLNLRIETPKQLTTEVWEKLMRYMEVIKPG